MEEYPLSHYFYQQSPWNYLLTSPPLFTSPVLPENHVQWSQTAESHIYSVDLPGVRKEEIKVEVEDSRYLIIRTQATDQLTQPAKAFMRKFRLPGRVEIEGISAEYEDGVLTVTVPRSCRRISLIVDSGFAPQSLEVVARAA